MALAKANASTGDPTELIQQDLAQGEGGALEQGDSVEVKYTGWLFSSGTLGKVIGKKNIDILFCFVLFCFSLFFYICRHIARGIYFFREKQITVIIVRNKIIK